MVNGPDKAKVLYVGLGWPIPTFIARRARMLHELGLPLTVVGDRRARRSGALGSLPAVWERERGAGLLHLLLGAAVRPGRFRRLMRSLNGSVRARLYFLARHPYLAWIPKPLLIHQQWIGSAEVWSCVARALGAPLLASARGSQVTLEPHDPSKRATIQRCLAAADAVHCVSDGIRQRCEELGAEKGKLFVNYNGIDTAKFAPARAHASMAGEPGSLRLVTVGALIARKNVHTQLLVLRGLRRNGVKAVLTVVGAGPDELALRHCALALGVGDAVRFVGRQPEDSVIEHLHAADVYLSASVAEGLANSVLEAAACGLPVVAFDCEGMREVIGDGVSGCVVPFGDVAGMVAILKKLAEDSAVRQAMGAAGRERVCARFDARTCAQEMIEHYQRIVSAWEQR